MPEIAQTLLIAVAVLLAHWVNLSWASEAGIVLLGGSLVAYQKNRTLCRRVGWAGCAIAWAGAVTTNIWWDYYAVICAVVAAAIWLAGREWILMALAWLFLAFAICVGAGYLEDTNGMFYFGILGAVAVLVFYMTRFKAPVFVIHAFSTLFLLLIGLLVADFFTEADKKIDMNPATWRRYYSFDGARGNPGAMAKWWQFFSDDQCPLMENDIFDTIPGGSPGHRLRPNSHAKLF